MVVKELEKRDASGEIELSYLWTEKISGFQDEYIERSSLFAKDGNKVVLEEVSGVVTTFNGCNYDVKQYEISIEKLIEFIKEECDNKRNETRHNRTYYEPPCRKKEENGEKRNDV